MQVRSPIHPKWRPISVYAALCCTLLHPYGSLTRMSPFSIRAPCATLWLATQSLNRLRALTTTCFGAAQPTFSDLDFPIPDQESSPLDLHSSKPYPASHGSLDFVCKSSSGCGWSSRCYRALSDRQTCPVANTEHRLTPCEGVASPPHCKWRRRRRFDGLHCLGGVVHLN